MRFARQRDANEPAIVRALEAVGASVSKQNEKGAPDLLVGFAGETFLLEVKRATASGKPKRTQPGRRLESERKTDERGLLDSQQEWWERWRGKPPVVVTTPAEALGAIGWRQAPTPEPLPELMGCSKCSYVFDVRGANRYVDGVHPPLHWLKVPVNGRLPICPGHRLPATLPELNKETDGDHEG